MKRSLICLILAAVLCAGGMVAAAVAVNAARDQVYYTETIHMGDHSMVEGLVVTSEIEMIDQLFWTVEHRPGEKPFTETEYQYFSSPQIIPREKEPVGITLRTSVADDLDTYADISKLTGMRRVLRELYEELEPGESEEKRIRLADYYEFYPIGMSVLCSDGSHLGGWAGEVYYVDSEPPEENMSDEQKAWHTFREFFKIPVLENHMYRIEVERGTSNSNFGYMAGDIIENKEDDLFEMNTISVLTEDTCYFTFDTRTVQGKVVNTDYIPGGYGIYSFGYEPEGTKIFSGDGSDLAVVYPLDPEVRVKGLFTAREGKELLLFTMEDGERVSMLTVIDTATMETIKRIEITRGAEGEDVGMYGFQIHDDFLALRTYNNKLAVVTWDEGEYRLAFTVDANPDPEERRIVAFPEYPVMAWDGERLAVRGILYAYGAKYGHDTCGFKLTVYDKTGMIFCGDYFCSLHTENAYRSDCMIVRERFGNPVGQSIRWAEG